MTNGSDIPGELLAEYSRVRREHGVRVAARWVYAQTGRRVASLADHYRMYALPDDGERESAMAEFFDPTGLFALYPPSDAPPFARWPEPGSDEAARLVQGEPDPSEGAASAPECPPAVPPSAALV